MNLTARQFSLLLDEVAAMARADRPLAIGLAELNHRSLGRIGRAAGVLARQMKSGQPPEVAIQQLGGKLGVQAAAAMKTLQSTGSPEPVARLAETLRRQSDMRIQWIVSMIYPLITALVAYFVVSLVMSTLVIDSWPTEILGKKESTRFIGVCVWLRSHFWLPPLVICVLAILVSLVRQRNWFPLERFDKATNYRAWSTFCDMLAVQMSAGVPLGDAVQVSADATGSESVRRAAQHAIVGTAVPMNAQDRLKPSAANSVPPMVCWLLKHAKEHSTASTSQQLRVLADWYRDSALRRFRFWILWVPTAVTAVVGGGASLLYCLVLLPPLFDGLRQLVR